MPRLLAALRRAFHRSLAPDLVPRGAPAHSRGEISRRGFLASLGLAAAALPTLGACAPRRRKADIAIVGAGLAGLTCAYRLRQAGLEAAVFEGQRRVGGRVWSVRDTTTGQVMELGGEFIDTNHVVMRGLCVELGLGLVDLVAADEGVRAEDYWFGGRRLAEGELSEAWQPVARQIAADLAALEEGALARFDALSLADYLAGLEGLDPLLGEVLKVAYTAEYGLEVDEQSALNLLWLIGTDPDALDLYGASDERYRIAAGNDRLPALMAEEVAPQLELGHRLVAVRERADGRYTLVFEAGARTVERTFSEVVLTVPWSVLREVRFEPGLPEARRLQLETLGYGQNCKLLMGFQRRPWRTRHESSGTAFFASGPQSTWETSRGQAGEAGILTVFSGGAAGVGMGVGQPEVVARGLLSQIEGIFPGLSEAYRAGSAVRMHWPSFAWSRGSYACFKPGQGAWAGALGAPIGNLHFAGEHVSVEAQGFMEGAAETGTRAALALLAGRRS